MGLFRPIWMKENLEGSKLVDALFKVRDMTSQGELRKVAVRAPHGQVADAAIKRIGDQAFLERIALGQEPTASSSARLSAASCLDDQEALVRVACTSSDEHARIAAMEKIEDAMTVAGIARAATDSYERKRGLEAAKQRVRHCADDALVQLAMGDADLCGEAVKALDDPLLKYHPNPAREDMVKSIALSSPFEEAWRKALDILRSEVLAQLVREDANGERGRAAVRKLLTDDLGCPVDDEVVQLFADVALEGSDEAPRAVALIPAGHATLANVARSAKRLEVRKAAILKLADQDLLLQLAYGDADVAIDAAARLDGQYTQEFLLERFDPAAIANDASLSDTQKEALFYAAAEAIGGIDDLRVARQAVARIAAGADACAPQAAARAQELLEKLEKSYRRFVCSKCSQPVRGARYQDGGGFEFRCGCPDGFDDSNWEIVVDENGERSGDGRFHLFEDGGVWVCTTCHGLKSTVFDGKMPVKPRCTCEGAWPYKKFFEFMESGDDDAIAIPVEYRAATDDDGPSEVAQRAEAPAGIRTLVCPECGGPIVYHEAYESYDSWKVIGFFHCEKRCDDTVYAGKPLDRYAIGEVPPSELDGDLVLLCPDCRKLRGSATAKPDAYDRKPTKLEKCTCGSTANPIPVIWSIDY